MNDPFRPERRDPEATTIIALKIARKSDETPGTTRKESKSINWHVYKISIDLPLGHYIVPIMIQKMMNIMAMKWGRSLQRVGVAELSL